MSLVRSFVLLAAILWALIGAIMLSKPTGAQAGEIALFSAIYFAPLVGAIIFWFWRRRNSN